MGRKKFAISKKMELVTLITNYEEAKAENRQLYLDADQLADIADWYASERKFEEAQEVITYGLKIHPGKHRFAYRTSISLPGYPKAAKKQEKVRIRLPKNLIPK